MLTIAGSGFAGGFGTTTCAARVHETITCTNTYTPSGTGYAGQLHVHGSFSGDINYSASSSPELNNLSIVGATSSTSVVSSAPTGATYATPITFTANRHWRVWKRQGRKEVQWREAAGHHRKVTWSSIQAAVRALFGLS